jgi:hypothetical protein
MFAHIGRSPITVHRPHPAADEKVAMSLPRRTLLQIGLGATPSPARGSGPSQRDLTAVEPGRMLRTAGGDG